MHEHLHHPRKSICIIFGGTMHFFINTRKMRGRKMRDAANLYNILLDNLSAVMTKKTECHLHHFWRHNRYYSAHTHPFFTKIEFSTGRPGWPVRPIFTKFTSKSHHLRPFIVSNDTVIIRSGFRTITKYMTIFYQFVSNFCHYAVI